MKRTLSGNAGFTFIELALGILIIGVAYVGIMYAQREVQQKNIEVEAIYRATSYANTIMARVRSHRFDEKTSPPWSTALGPDETQANKYDDIDDYIGYTWEGDDENLPGYTAKVRVFYVNPTNSWVDSVAQVTDYKRIIVTVSHDALAKPLQLSSLMTPHKASD